MLIIVYRQPGVQQEISIHKALLLKVASVFYMSRFTMLHLSKSFLIHKTTGKMSFHVTFFV